MRGVKILGIVIGAVVGLVILALAAVLLFVHPNDFRGRIEKGVKASTGRDLDLQGDLKLSVFPWVALEFGPASLGNPEGFGKEPFASVQKASLRVKLWPLLHKELEVGRIEVDTLDLNLQKNAEGKGNWEDFGQKKTPAVQPAAGAGPTALPSLAGIVIKDSRIRYQTMTLSKVNLDVGNVAPAVPVPVKASFDLDTGPGGSRTSFNAALDLRLDPEAKRYGLQAADFNGELKLGAEGRSVPWKFSTPAIDVDLAAQTLKAAAFSASAGAAQVSGSLAGEKIIDAPSISGSFKLDSVVLRELCNRLGIDLPKTRDPKALTKLAASSDFAYGDKAVRLSRLDVQLDDSHLRGSAGVENLDTKALKFDLNIDRIDLDRYRSPEAAPAAAKAPAKPVELPTTPVKALNLAGRFAIESATVSGMSLSNVRLTMSAKDGLVHLAPIKASLYGGHYSGDITYDVRGNTPSVKLDQQVSSVDIAALLKDGFKSTRLSGRGNASTQLAGAGRTNDALVKALNGRVAANLNDGAVNGIDLWYEISRAQALLKRQPLPPGSEDKRTKFDTLKVSADIAGGIATTKDLTITSPYLRVTGGGTANLTSQAINYHIVATILKEPPSSGGPDMSSLTLAGIPVEISGTMASPSVRPDLAGLVKSQIKQKLQETIQNKLQGLFNR